MQQYKLWFLGGMIENVDYLGPAGNPSKNFDKYVQLLQSIWKEECRSIGKECRRGETSNCQFYWKKDCKVQQFTNAWKDPATIGIIWHSHGDTRGYPYAIDGKIDPVKLPQVSPRLYFLVLFSCLSAYQRWNWKPRCPSLKDWALKTYDRQLKGNSQAEGDIGKWIKGKASGSTFERLTGYHMLCARNAFRYAILGAALAGK